MVIRRQANSTPAFRILREAFLRMVEDAGKLRVKVELKSAALNAKLSMQQWIREDHLPEQHASFLEGKQVNGRSLRCVMPTHKFLRLLEKAVSDAEAYGRLIYSRDDMASNIWHVRMAQSDDCLTPRFVPYNTDALRGHGGQATELFTLTMLEPGAEIFKGIRNRLLLQAAEKGSWRDVLTKLAEHVDLLKQTQFGEPAGSEIMSAVMETFGCTASGYEYRDLPIVVWVQHLREPPKQQHTAPGTRPGGETGSGGSGWYDRGGNKGGKGKKGHGHGQGQGGKSGTGGKGRQGGKGGKGDAPGPPRDRWAR